MSAETYNKTLVGQIITSLADEGVRVSNIVHIGDNVFEMDYDDTGFLSGTFGKAQYTVKEGKVVLVKLKVIGMS